jgi:hypothetical protein
MASDQRGDVLNLYSTKGGWERLKELVDAHEDRVARHQAFADRIAPAARNIHDPCPCGSGKKFKRSEIRLLPAVPLGLLSLRR